MIRRVAGLLRGAKSTVREREARGRRGLLASLLLAALIAGLLFGVTPGRSGYGSLGSPAVARADVAARGPGKAALRSNQAVVTISGQSRTKAIPRRFLGISTEFTTLPLVEKHIDLWERVLSPGVLEPPRETGDLIVRIGGDSAEHVVYNKQPIKFPPWAFVPTPKLVHDTARVIEELGLQVIIDINTITGTPHEVGAWMRDLTSSVHLRSGKLAAFELGNEPDIYNQEAWKGGIGERAVDPSTLNRGGIRPNLPKEITPTSFARTYLAYARALRSAAPNVPIVAPAIAKPTNYLGWIKTLLRRPHPGLKVISIHDYPYTACPPRGGPKYGTIQKVLSENATAGMARTVAPAVALAHKAGLPIRLTEINSVTCGGVQGVSNTFATALWAPDALFELLRAGVEGVNLHSRVESINRPFSFSSQGLETRPLLYGMIVFSSMLGPGARFVPVRVSSGRSLHLKVWAVKESRTHLQGPPNILNPLKVLVINKGRTSAVINLHLPTSDRAEIERLLAPSASSTSGVTWDGEQLNHQVKWQGKYKVQSLRPSRNGVYVLRVTGESAALLEVAVAASKLPAQPSVGPRPLFGYE